METWLIVIGLAITCIGIASMATSHKKFAKNAVGVALFVIGVFIALWNLMLVLPSGETKQTEPTTEEVTVDTSVSFEEIYREYKDNELRADDLYKGNRYRIEAKINGMTSGGLLNMTGGATLTMEKQVDLTIVIFYAEFEKDQEEALKTVNVGDTIVFEGTCMKAGSWTDCKLITE